MKVFTDLEAWKIGMELVLEIYRLTSAFPSEEKFGLTSQLRRASTSILANMAEGCGRFTYADRFAKFVIARGECFEVNAFLHIASELNFLKRAEANKVFALVDRTSRLLSGLMASAKKAS